MLQSFSNLEFRAADGLALPLPDRSVDLVFANMYLRQMPESFAPFENWCASCGQVDG